MASGRLMPRSTPEEAMFYSTTLTEAIVQRLEKEMEHAANVTIYTSLIGSARFPPTGAGIFWFVGRSLTRTLENVGHARGPRDGIMTESGRTMIDAAGKNGKVWL